MMKLAILLVALGVVSATKEVVGDGVVSNIHRISLDYSKTDKAFVGTISIGSPPQSLNVAFDVNTGLLWVPETGCPCAENCAHGPEGLCYDVCSPHCCLREPENVTITEASTGFCTRKNAFDQSQSSTYFNRKQSVESLYLNETIKLNMAYDTLRLGPHHKPALSVRNFLFGHTKALPEPYTDIKYDGVFGLARSAPNGAKTPIQQLAEKRVITSPVVTLSFGQRDEPYNLYDGIVALGNIDEGNCAFYPKSFIPTVSRDEWDFRIASVRINNTNHPTLRQTATIDPSSLYIHLPPTIFKLFKGPTTYDEKTGRLFLNCVLAERYFKNFQFSLSNGFNYEVPYERLVKTLYPEKCELFVRESSDERFLLGLPFLQRRCVVLDYNGRIGIADYSYANN